MEQGKGNYRLLINKLDAFIRKYYVNRLIKGILYSISLVLLLFLLFNVLEYNFYFGKSVRKGMFFSFIGVSGLAILYWVFFPIVQYFKLGNVISHNQAAQIIGDHFGDVKDKLLNILQLKKQAETTADNGLILAGIDQKSEVLKPVPFQSAIDLSKNRKYLKYALPPLLCLVVLLFAAPSLLKESTSRIIHNNEEFEKAAPFHFKINNEDLTVVQFDDFELTVTTEGAVVPNEIFIEMEDFQYRLKQTAPNTFSYKFNNVQKETEFQLFSGDVRSTEETLNIIKKPSIAGFDIQFDYPAYTGRKDDVVSNIGDMVIPQGTNVKWVFNTQNTDDISLLFSSKDELQETNRDQENRFSYKKRTYRDETYKMYVSNKQLPKSDSISYSINVIPDQHPSISVEKFVDSTDNKLLYFVGTASDDYGLRDLSFNYRIKKEKGGEGQLNTIKMVKPANKEISYDHLLDIHELALKPGDALTFYFEVFDNDGVNGSKSAKTGVMSYKIPSVEEFEEMASKNNEDIKDELEKSRKESKEIKEDMKKLRDDLIQKKELQWQEKKEIEKLLERQKELQKQVEQTKEKFDENLKNQEEFDQPTEDVLEKQEKIQEMFEELMSPEMKELMEKFQELMEEMDKAKAAEMMEEMKYEDEDLEKELDRMLELFKQLELEQEIDKQIEKLEELAEEEEKLSEESEKGEKSEEELEKKQEEIQEEMEKLKEKMEEIEKKNEELEKPKDLEDREEQMEDIQEEMEESKDELKKGDKKKAGKKQKDAAEKMKQMAEQMQMEMEAGEAEQMEEDMASLRQLLENLVTLSFDQEGLAKDFNRSKINTPRYVDLVQDQFRIKDDFRIVEDSLQALSKRVIQIESFVSEKVGEIKVNVDKSLEHLEERRKTQAGETQQRTMKNLNDLALMLSEVMEQMQQQMSGSMPGTQMCNKPGTGQGKDGKKPSDNLGDAQEQLNKQMEQMKKAMEKGSPGGQGGMSEQFAKMAAKQAALREALKEAQKEAGEKGQGSKELQELINEMNKTETDLVNKRLTNEMLKRQEEIKTRLLEAEKAMKERKWDDKRKAETATQVERKIPPALEEYIKEREAEIEMFKTVSPALKPYYKYMVEEYYKSLKTK